MAEPRVQKNFSLDEDLADDLEGWAEKADMFEVEILREALRMYFNEKLRPEHGPLNGDDDE